jgi:hypothetical protein
LNSHFKTASGSFVFDVFDGALVVMPVAEARRLARLNDALADSSTWREFLSRVASDGETTGYLEDQYGGELPRPDDPFDPEDIPGFRDGDWPLWPKAEMLYWIPPSVRALGTVKDSLLSGSFLHLDEARRDEVVAAMVASRLEFQAETEDLVSRACGAWRYA